MDARHEPPPAFALRSRLALVCRAVDRCRCAVAGIAARRRQRSRSRTRSASAGLTSAKCQVAVLRRRPVNRVFSLKPYAVRAWIMPLPLVYHRAALSDGSLHEKRLSFWQFAIKSSLYGMPASAMICRPRNSPRGSAIWIDMELLVSEPLESRFIEAPLSRNEQRRYRTRRAGND
jgi:hypothetical protein